MNASGRARPIVVGVDDRQLAAVQFALDEARIRGCGVRIVHANDFPVAATASAYFGAAVLHTGAEGVQDALGATREFVEAHDVVVPVEYVVDFGAATKVLESESSGACALVLGPAAAPWYERILAGEVGSRLALHASCPVIVVPDSWYPPRDRQGGIVVTLDGDTNAHGPLTYAFEAADSRREELHVLHTVPPATTVRDAEEHAANIAEILVGWAENFPAVHVLRSMTVGNPRDACMRATQSANLVVVGRPHGQLLPFALSRPVAMAVLREANCPVAVVPPDYDG